MSATAETRTQTRWTEAHRLTLDWRLDEQSCIARDLLAQGCWEPDTTKLIADLVRPGMTVLDVGANFGYFTLLLARLVGPFGRVIACEPVATYREQLHWHLQRNKVLERVTVLPCGLSDAERSAGIAVGTASATMHGSNGAAARETIALRTLDSLVDELRLEHLDVVKIDVDGHEPNVLRGAMRTLARWRPRLVVEFAAHCLHVAGTDVRAQRRLLHEAGYELCDERTRAPFASEMAFLVRCGNFDRSANVLAEPVEALAGARTRVVDSIAELQRGLGLPHAGRLVQDDLDVEATECDAHGRKRRDAEVLATVARNVAGDALDLGTSWGRSAAEIASNLQGGRVWTVNMLPDEAAAAGVAITHVLTREQIGAFYRERDLGNVNQVYANTLTWTPPPECSDLGMAFVDACHDAETVRRDSALAWGRLRPGGFLLWHDWSPTFRRQHDWIDSVMRGASAFLAEHAPAAEVWHLRNSWIGLVQKP